MSLLVIALVLGLLVHRQHGTHADQIRIQGLNLTRSLSALPMETLAPRNGRPSVLLSLFAAHDNPDFAYAAVTGRDGAVRAEVASPGTLVVTAPAPGGASSLFGERALSTSPDGRSVREFYGPVIEDGDVKGFVRVAFFPPAGLVARGDLSFFAALALAIFALVPLAYLLLKRELAPLGAISAQLQQLASAGAAPPQPPHPDAADLSQRLLEYLGRANARISALEGDNERAVTGARLLEYGSNKMNAVLHCMPDGLIILDPAGEVTFANSKIEPMLGVDLAEVLTTPIKQWCRDPDLRNLLDRYSNESSEAGRQLQIEFAPALVPDKQLIASGQPLIGGHGRMAFGTLIVLRDATREYLAQQAGNDFVAHVSHELKSPLNVISMYAETLQDAGPDDQALRVESLNVIQDEVERMNGLVNNLLNVSKLEMGSMTPERHRVKLDDLLRDAYNNALPRAQGKAMKMDLQIPRELAAVSIDKDMFRIALNNLITNAIKYNEPGGAVSLIAEEGEHDVVITVKDSGIGIAHSDQAHVFEKFYRARESASSVRGGHGLGLYLTAQIIELHHGRVTLRSELGQGSEFSIHLKKMPALLQGANVL
jgi:signal transduction histidine kinase